jgi:hypothetical protein
LHTKAPHTRCLRHLAISLSLTPSDLSLRTV